MLPRAAKAVGGSHTTVHPIVGIPERSWLSLQHPFELGARGDVELGRGAARGTAHA